MPAYDDSARAYLAAGWAPIPVRGKTMPAKGATGYDGTVTPEKVEGWLQADTTARARAGRGVGLDNIGLRHQLTLAIDVDQGYGNKGGVAQLAAWATKVGLPPLPATWSSTARGDDSPSRQYLYRIDADVVFKTKPCEAVELCCWHHRFTVCAPTIHPTTGTPYTWYEPAAAGVPPTWGSPSAFFPTPAHLPILPTAWTVALRGGVANADRSAETVDLPELMAAFPTGDPDGLVRWLIAKWSDPAQHVGHDEAKDALINCFMVGREGHPGVPDLYAVLVQRYTDYLAVARPDVAAAEVRSLVTACAVIAQQKPVTPTAGPFVAMGYRSVDDFLAGRKTPLGPPVADGPTPSIEAAFTTAATDEELAYFLAGYTGYSRPDKLGRRAAWMKTEEPARLAWHTRCMVADALAGQYPAARALDALAAAYAAHGGQDPHGARALLSVALGAVLNAKVSA